MEKPQTKIPHCKNIALVTANIALLYNNGLCPNAPKQVGTPQKQNITFLRHTSLLLLLFTLGFGSKLKAQSKDTLTHKWEIGTDLLWLLDKNSLPKYSIFARRALSNSSALRLRVGADVKTDPRNIGFGVEKASFLIRFGYEKQKKLSLNTGVFWGFDTHFRKENIEGYLIQLPQVKPLYYPDYSWQLGGVAIFGFRYFLGEHFSLSAESSIAAYYREFNSNNYSNGLLIIVSNNYVSSGNAAFLYRTTLKSFVLEVSPMQVLNFSYHF